MRYQKLFNYLSEEHGVTLLETDMQEICNIANKIHSEKKAAKITLFEKFCLFFIQPKYKVDFAETHTLKYKVFCGKMYVLAHWMNPPKHWNCRSQVVSQHHH